MNLKELAILSGVTVERCDPEWGGTYAYKTKDHPNCSIAGFRSENQLYKAWVEDTFGKHCYKAIMSLLDK